MTATKILTGRDIGAAEAASRAVLDALLTESGTTFHQWVALSLLANSAEVVEQDRLVNQMTGGLKIDEATVLAALDELIDLELVARTRVQPPVVEMRKAGADHHRLVQRKIDRTTDRLYRGLEPDDLVTTRRVLATLTERANTELASR